MLILLFALAGLFLLVALWAQDGLVILAAVALLIGTVVMIARILSSEYGAREIDDLASDSDRAGDEGEDDWLVEATAADWIDWGE